ncbi:MAG: hypothetical protein KGZ40_09525 [Clostridiales bacterium]|nr:hypothetical protein [Clostridiales bacterium]
MEWTQTLVVVLLVVAIAALCVLIYALVEAIATVRAARRVARDIEERLPGLAEKAEVALDAFSAELLRLDAIIGQVEEVTARVNGAATLIYELANVPTTAASLASEGLRSVWQRMKRDRG